MKLGPGPVFVYETLLSTRRWQVYAVRSFYVLVILIGLAVVWSSRNTAGAPTVVGAAPRQSFQQMAELGKSFFYTITGIQIVIVLLAAPAIAAGTICMDRARGTLLHMMVTDLSDGEIVLGKLGSRLIPVFCWLVCGIPVTALVALLGGVDYNALFGAFLIALTLGIVGCCLAMFVSIWAKKTHEVIMAVYMIEAVYLLALPMWWVASVSAKYPAPPDWFRRLNAFELAYEPYNRPGVTSSADYAIFMALGLAISAILTFFTVVLLRRSVVSEAGRPGKASSRRVSLGWLGFPKQLGPSLDGNPVLWREWHRSRPSRLSRILWTLLMVSTWSLVVWGAAIMIEDGFKNGPNPLPFGLLFQIFFGLLFLSATAPTALSEERVRSSLDVLLSTPLSTRKIVEGKWWGAFRLVLILVPLIMFASIFMAVGSPDLPSYATTAMMALNQFTPLNVTDRIIVPLLCTVDFLVSGAMLVSIGLLIATWVSRLGRAVAVSVVVYLAICVGWPILVNALFWNVLGPNSVVGVGGPGAYETRRAIMDAIASLSPVFGEIQVLERLMMTSSQPRTFIWYCQTAVIMVKLGLAVGLFYLTVGTFDRRLGRVSETAIMPRRMGRGGRSNVAPIADDLVAIGENQTV